MKTVSKKFQINRSKNTRNQNSTVQPAMVCHICGDTAYGTNFCVISCDSCRMFFKRNASKANTLKCSFKEDCDIGVTTRRFCPTCRLRKYFKVGMNSEAVDYCESAKKRRRLEPEIPKQNNAQLEKFEIRDSPTVMDNCEWSEGEWNCDEETEEQDRPPFDLSVQNIVATLSSIPGIKVNWSMENNERVPKLVMLKYLLNLNDQRQKVLQSLLANIEKPPMDPVVSID